MRATFKMIYLLSFITFLSAPANNNFKLPVLVPDGQWRPLRESTDEVLQQKLRERVMAKKQWAYLVKKHRMSVGLVELSNPAKPRFAQINGDTMLYAASLPKIAILLAAYNAFQEGALKENPAIKRDLLRMIKRSDNPSASRMIDRLGYRYIERVLREYKLFDPEFGGGLWIGKRYARYGGRYPDPLKKLVHAASATQVCRFYYMLATGRLINPERCRQMLAILGESELHHKFVNAIDRFPEKIMVYRKSGTWRFYHSDSALVWGPKWRRYILVALVEDKNGEQIMRQLVPLVEKVLQERAGSY